MDIWIATFGEWVCVLAGTGEDRGGDGDGEDEDKESVIRSFWYT
jgi:hypothetical protein